MAKSHLKTKTRSSRPNPSRIKASTAPESPKQAAKRTISAQNICKIWVSERESCERNVGELKRNSETGLAYSPSWSLFLFSLSAQLERPSRRP